MTSVGTIGSSQLEPWMVSKLFGSASQSQNSAEAAAPTSTPPASSTPTVSAKATVSSATVQAFTMLPTVWDDLAIVKAMPPGSYEEMSLTQANEQLNTVRDMTSDQLSAAMYGAGLPSFYLDGHDKSTFADFLANNVETTEWKTKVANDTRFSDSVRKDVAADIAPETAQNEAMQAAYANHTLVFQKASDVEGLDFSSTDIITGGDPNKPPTGETYTETFSYAFLEKEGTNHSLINYGGASMYLTW